MSGGSYNYLFCKGAEDLLYGQGLGDLNEMAETLLDMGYSEEAKETYAILFEVKKVREELEGRVNKISDLWKAVEYYESMDADIEAIKVEVEKLRSK